MAKSCTECKKPGLLGDFPKDKSSLDGRFHQCKKCVGASGAQVCTTCCQKKPLTDFYEDKRSLNGRHSGCIACHKDRHRKRLTKPDVPLIRAALETAGAKVCTVCEVRKPLTEFWKQALRTDGYAVECKDCTRKYVSKYRKRPENKAKELERSRRAERIKYRNERDSSCAGRALVMVNSARANSKVRGHSFPVTVDPKDIQAILEIGVCEVSGLPFDLRRGLGRRSPFSPSLDRIDPKKGYVKGNVQVVVWCYNAARGDWGDEVLNTLVQALSKREQLPPQDPGLLSFRGKASRERQPAPLQEPGCDASRLLQ